MKSTYRTHRSIKKRKNSSLKSNSQSIQIIHTTIRSSLRHSKIQGENVSRAPSSKVSPHLYKIDISLMKNQSFTRLTSSSWRCDRKGTTEDLWQRSKKRRKRKYCRYSYLCMFMSVCGAVLLAISIAALLVGLLVKTSKSTTTTTIPKYFILLTSTQETIYGLWNTTAGGSSTLSSPGSSTGNYNPNETPQNVFDQNRTTKYTNYGPCNGTSGSFAQCGTNTGFYLTLQRGISLLTTIRFLTTPSLPERDPMHITVEGSNQPSSALLLIGSSWTLLYNGTSGLDSNPGRSSFGMTLVITNNMAWYNSYRVLITSIRNMSNGVQYSEVEMIGY